jgi:hypothetical protein
LRDRGYDIQAGQGLYGLGQAESQAGTQGLKTLGDIGTQELGYEQSKIEAPLTRAQNVAQIMRGYTYPMTTQETKETLPGAFAPSPLQQIAGLGTLVNAGSGKDGLFTKGFDLAKELVGGVKTLLPGSGTDMYGNPSGAGGSSGYIDSSGNYISAPAP